MPDNALNPVLTPGTRLGPYEITALLGAGGMGEVYRGRDTRLGRDVAIKVLRDPAASPELRARFEREARAISSLSHPHICSLFDVGEGYLVMELLDGETLADRLARGPIPLRDALKLGEQIASALARAHRDGILHRDLKPGNIMITRSGAKLLDFGLARNSRPTPTPADATEQKPLTHEGTVLGTLQYMSPEQLSGAVVDARADIFALGAILYEMVTGKRAFDGSTRTSIVAAIVSGEVRPMSELQPLTPPSLEHVVRRCLWKEPDDRWDSAHDVASELAWISTTLGDSGMMATSSFPWRRRTTIAWAVAMVLVAAASLLAGRYLWQARHEGRAVRFQFPLPAGTHTTGVEELGLSLSPDGSRLAFVVQNARGQREMWIRAFDSGKSTLVEGSTGSSYPFWSPDGRFIAFFAEGKLKKAPVGGGPIETLCDSASGRGGAWSEDGTIIFTPTSRSPIFRVPASGGQPQQVTRLQGDQRAHRFPSFLPDGKRFLFATGSAIAEGRPVLMLGDLSGRAIPLVENASSGQYVAPGFVLFVRNDALLSVRFNERNEKLIGQPVAIASEVGYHRAKNWGMFSVDQRGNVAFVPFFFGQSEFRLVDRAGHVEAVVTDRAVYSTGDLSPDGQRVATLRSDPSASNGRVDLWITDIATARSRRVSTDPNGFQDVRWAPDGKRLMVTGGTGGILDLLWHGLDGKSELVLQTEFFKRHPDFSPDGKWVVFVEQRPRSQWDIAFMSLQPRKAPEMFVSSPGSDSTPRFSPDGRFIAFASTAGGAPDIYVKRFPDTGEQWQVSSGGGVWPRWSPDGRELYFERPDGMLMAAVVDRRTSFEAGDPKPLFLLPRSVMLEAPALAGITPDGKHFLVAANVSSDEETAFQIILNWQAAKPN